MVETYYEQTVNIDDEKRHSKKKFVFKVVKLVGLIIGLILLLLFFYMPIADENGNIVWAFLAFYLLFDASFFMLYFLMRRTLMRLNPEFDYFLKGNKFLIVVVYNRLKRCKLTEFDISAISEMGSVELPSLERHLASRPKILWAAANPDNEQLHYMLTNISGEKTVIYFEPDVAMLLNIRKSLGRDVVLKK